VFRRVTKLSHQPSTLDNLFCQGAAPVAKFLPRSIILTMVITFSVSFAIMFWQRNTQERPVPMVEATTNVAVSAAAVRLPIAERREPLAPAGRTVASTDHVAAATQSSEEEPARAEPLPVAFHIRNRRDLNMIDGDILNTTSKPMSITLRAVNPSTQAISEIHFQLAPGERKTYSTNDGLSMQANDQLIVQSPPYQDRVVQVP
jgi:hypothetical protein